MKTSKKSQQSAFPLAQEITLHPLNRRRHIKRLIDIGHKGKCL